jgi:hypothetical protein
LGKRSYCKICFPLYIKELKSTDKDLYAEKARKATQKYRDNNRERWRSLHRINQFNRKAKVKLVSDGTITDKVIKDLYNSELCYWCKQSIVPEKRTMEHIVRLHDGGMHTASNITMACISCNSSNLNKIK